MATPVKIDRYHVFLASPSGLDAERNAVRSFFAGFNAGPATQYGIEIQVVDWENYATFGIGTPQDLINKATLDRFSSSLVLVIGIIGQRFGTPTKNYGSGTEEEFYWALRSNKERGFPDIKLFFRDSDTLTVSSDPKEADLAVRQFKRVIRFRKKVQQLTDPVFYGTYRDETDFSRVLSDDLNRWLSMPDRPWVSLAITRSASELHRTSEAPVVDIPDAPTSTALLGRSAEYSELRQWILEDGCRAIGIIGPPGIGKTTLALALVEGASTGEATESKLSGVQKHFDFVVWRKLLDPPPLATLVRELVGLISGHCETRTPSAAEDLVELLLAYLTRSRCLLVFDNYDTVLRRDANVDTNSEQGYEFLIRSIAQRKHRSVIIVTSRVHPESLASSEGEQKPVRVRRLSGVSIKDGTSIVQSIAAIEAHPNAWRKLVTFYDGNPLSLEVVARHIEQVYDGALERFLEEGRHLFSAVEDILESQLRALPNDKNRELELLYWLALNRGPTTIKRLENDLLSFDARSSVTSTIASLRRWLPLNIRADQIGLQPVLIEYVTGILVARVSLELELGRRSREFVVQAFVDRLCAEVRDGTVALLNTHALVKANADHHVRVAQKHYVLMPALMRLREALVTDQAVESHLLDLVSRLRMSRSRNGGYAAGNLLNMLLQVHSTSRAYDFSGLDIRCADLGEGDLRGIRFRASSFSKCRFRHAMAAVMAADWSLDGQLVLSADTSGSVRLFNAESGELGAICRGAGNWMRAAAFSPVSSMLASGSHTGTVALWHRDGTRCRAIRGHENWINDVAWNPNGSTFATASEDRTVKIWQAEDLQECRRLVGHTDHVWAVSFSGDGTLIASASIDGTVRVWKAATGEETRVLHAGGQRFFSVAIDSSAGYVIAGTAEGEIHVWDLAMGIHSFTMRGHTKAVRCLSLSPDGKLLASASEDWAIRIWDMSAKGPCQQVLIGHRDQVRGVAWNPDGSLLVSGACDQTLRIWEIESGRCLRVIAGYYNAVWSVDCTHGDVIVTGGDDGLVRLWDLEGGLEDAALEGHHKRVWSVASSVDGKLAASGGDDCVVRVWSLINRRQVAALSGHTDWIRYVSFSEDGALLGSGSEDRTVRIWDTRSWRTLAILNGHGDRVVALDFSPSGSLIATACMDGKVRVWTLPSHKCKVVSMHHAGKPRQVSFLSESTVMTCDEGGHVTLWSVDRECPEWEIIDQKHEIWAMCINKTRGVFACGGEDGAIRLRRTSDGQLIRAFEGHEGRIYGLAFARDGSILVSVAEDESVRVWSVDGDPVVARHRIPGPYHGMDITGASGLSASQVAGLVTLGAETDGATGIIDTFKNREP